MASASCRSLASQRRAIVRTAATGFRPDRSRRGRAATLSRPPAGGRRTPVATIDWAEPLAIGAEFVRWEIATAIAGALLEINPFDEPNVQQAKDATSGLAWQVQSTGTLPALLRT